MNLKGGTVYEVAPHSRKPEKGDNGSGGSY